MLSEMTLVPKGEAVRTLSMVDKRCPVVLSSAGVAMLMPNSANTLVEITKCFRGSNSPAPTTAVTPTERIYVMVSLIAPGSWRAHTKAAVTTTSSTCHVRGARRVLLYHRSTTMSRARVVNKTAGIRADCWRFAVASCERTNQLGECMPIVSSL